MDIEDLPEWLQDVVDNCPRSGAGVNTWLFNTARQLHWHCPDKAELTDLLEEAIHGPAMEWRNRVRKAIEDVRVEDDLKARQALEKKP